MKRAELIKKYKKEGLHELELVVLAVSLGLQDNSDVSDEGYDYNINIDDNSVYVGNISLEGDVELDRDRLFLTFEKINHYCRDLNLSLTLDEHSLLNENDIDLLRKKLCEYIDSKIEIPKENLVEKVVNQIKIDLENKDETAIEELLMNVSYKYLKEFLSEE